MIKALKIVKKRRILSQRLKKNLFFQQQKMVMVKTSHFDYRLQPWRKRNYWNCKLTKNGNISSSFPVFEGDDIWISTNKGRVIRVAAKEIRTAGRNTKV